jgi:hypothetical protein
MRTRQVNARLTEAEYKALITGKPAGVPVGVWLRTRALKRRLPRAIPEVNQQAWASLARVSGNLNQLARAINEGRADRPAVDLAELRRLVDDLRRELIGLGSSEGAADDEE